MQATQVNKSVLSALEKKQMMKKIILLTLVLLTAINVSSQEINWMTFEEAIALQKKNPKKIMVDVYTVWCGPCKSFGPIYEAVSKKQEKKGGINFHLFFLKIIVYLFYLIIIYLCMTQYPYTKYKIRLIQRVNKNPL